MRTKANIRADIHSDVNKFIEAGGKLIKVPPSKRGKTVKSLDKQDFSALPSSIKVKFNLK
jgi:hypothetical protein